MPPPINSGCGECARRNTGYTRRVPRPRRQIPCSRSVGGRADTCNRRRRGSEISAELCVTYDAVSSQPGIPTMPRSVDFRVGECACVWMKDVASNNDSGSVVRE